MCKGMSRSSKMGHEATTVCTNADQRRATGSHRWTALARCLYHAPLPNPACFLQRPTSLPDSSQPGLCCADGTQRHQGLPPAGIGVSPTGFLTTQECKASAAWRQSRSFASHPTPKSSHLWQADLCMDVGFGSRSVPQAGLDRATCKHRVDPPSSQAFGCRLATSQRLDYLPRPRIRAQKKRRDTLIAAACRRAEQGWVVGYGDEVWWGRYAQPRMHTWAEQGKPLRLQEFEAPKAPKGQKDNSDPKALCCYGLLREDTGQMLLRFVDGRPVSHVSTAYLEWVCERLAEEGKRVLVLIWDNASWHISREVH